MLFDTHCHIAVENTSGSDAQRVFDYLAEWSGQLIHKSSSNEQCNPSCCDEPSSSPATTTTTQLPSRVGVCLCSTSPEDWSLVGQVARTSRERSIGFLGELRAGYGLHPWWVRPELVMDHVLPALRSLLLSSTEAFIGEIGIDGIRNNQHFHLQMEWFVLQMQLAAELSRPVSVHCVKSFGPMLEYLSAPSSSLPPVFVFHCFTGSPDFVQSLKKTRAWKTTDFYFGFGNIRTKHFAQLIGSTPMIGHECPVLQVPSDRILLESDQFCPLQSRRVLADIVSAIAANWKVPLDGVLERTAANARHAFRIG
jgi:Tat protein secretion system quality control protein TatD with DNase activity